MALHVFRTIRLHTQRPTTLRIKTLHMRSPLIKPYSHQEGQFMGVDVPQQEAEQTATTLTSTIASLKQEGCVIIKRSGNTPPFAMNMAYGSSVSCAEGATWLDFWKERSMYDLLDKMTVCMDAGVTIIIEHGTADINVSYQDIVATIDTLKANFPKLDIWQVLTGDKDHA
jgi:hypothetical protein